MNPVLAQAIRTARMTPQPPPKVVPMLAWRTPSVVELVPLARAAPVGELPAEALPRILQEVAARHGYMVDALRRSAKGRGMALARQEFMYRAAAETGASLCAIGRAVCRDHTTVRHGIGRYCAARGLASPRDFDFAAEVARRKAREADRLVAEGLAR